jgi:hypothetical protein
VQREELASDAQVVEIRREHDGGYAHQHRRVSGGRQQRDVMKPQPKRRVTLERRGPQESWTLIAVARSIL